MAIIGYFVSWTWCNVTLSAEEYSCKDVFVSGAEGYHTFRVPALVTSNRGTLLAFCEGRVTGAADDGDIDLVLKRSLNEGSTWSALQIVYEEGGAESTTIGNACPVVDQTTGTIWLAFTRNNNEVFMTHSGDDGCTWSSPTEITQSVKRPNWSWYATGPGHGIQIQNGPYLGRLVMPCDHSCGGDETVNSHLYSHCIYSDDHGRSWQLGKSTENLLEECTVVELSDGRLMLNMRNLRGTGHRAVALSDDGGYSWSKSVGDATLIEPVCHGNLLRYSWPHDGQSRILFCNPADRSERVNATVRLSLDEGKTWPIAKTLFAGPSAYSDLALLSDGRVGTLHEGGNDGPYERIMFTRFTIDWLEGADAASTE
jgi:sialidase-1